MQQCVIYRHTKGGFVFDLASGGDLYHLIIKVANAEFANVNTERESAMVGRVLLLVRGEESRMIGSISLMLSPSGDKCVCVLLTQDCISHTNIVMKIARRVLSIDNQTFS